MKNYISKRNNVKTLNPWFFTGFTDAEGCFAVNIIRDKEYRLGWRVIPRFQISLHKKDKALLEQIQISVGVGNVYRQGSQYIQYCVESVKALKVIINHFEKYPLITQKQADYELFKKAVELMEQKEHLTLEGLRKIVAIRASMNLGLPSTIEAAFPDIIPVLRPPVLNQRIEDPN
jgi:hypothetical protein